MCLEKIVSHLQQTPPIIVSDLSICTSILAYGNIFTIISYQMLCL